VPNFQISRDETLDNKPIIFVRKRVKIHLRQCRIPKFSGEDPGPHSKGREREGGKSGREKRGGEGEGEGKGMGRGGREGLKEREGMERGEKGGGVGKRNLDPRSSRQIDATGVKDWYFLDLTGTTRA
jgi:hypothetical protein